MQVRVASYAYETLNEDDASIAVQECITVSEINAGVLKEGTFTHACNIHHESNDTMRRTCSTVILTGK